MIKCLSVNISIKLKGSILVISHPSSPLLFKNNVLIQVRGLKNSGKQNHILPFPTQSLISRPRPEELLIIYLL